MGKLLLQPHLKSGNRKATTTIINGAQNNQKTPKTNAQECGENQESCIDSGKGPIDRAEKSTAVEWQTLSVPPWSNGPQPHYQRCTGRHLMASEAV